MTSSLDKITNQISEELHKWWICLYFIVLLLLMVVWFFDLSRTLKICSLFAIAVAQLLYNINTKFEDFFQRYLSWSSFLLLTLYAIILTALYVNEVSIAILTLLVIFGAFILGIVLTSGKSLWKSRKIHEIIIAYLALAGSLIVLFGFGFSIATDLVGNELKWISVNSNVTDAWDFIYFSALVFYTNTFGDILPYGFSKILVILELVISFVIHIIILGKVVNSDDIDTKIKA